MPRVCKPFDVESFVKLYLAGMSLKQCSDKFGVSRRALERRLKLRNLPVRGRSEAERLKNSRQTIAQRRKQVAAANAAVRGSTAPMPILLARARTRYERLLHIGKFERALHRELGKRKLSASQQTPVGKYNIDLTLDVPRIAVEVVTAWRDRAKSARPQRAEYILDQGWTVVLIFIDERRRGKPNIGALADKLVALAKVLSRNPSSRRQYGMLSGDAEPLPAARYDLEGRSRIPGF